MHRIFQILIAAVILLAAFSILGFLLDLAADLLGITIRILLILLVAAGILRLVEAIRD